MNNKSGLVVIAAGIAAFLIIKGGRDSGSLFGSGGGDSGQPTGTILAGPGTSSPPSTPSSLWSPSPTNNSPQSFGYVTPTGTYITPFEISPKIIQAMALQPQPNFVPGQTSLSAVQKSGQWYSRATSKNPPVPIVGNNPYTTQYIGENQTSAFERQLANIAAATGIPQPLATNPTKTTTVFAGESQKQMFARQDAAIAAAKGLDKYGFKIGSQWSPAYAEAGGYHGDSRNYATAVQLKRVPGLFVSSTGVHTAPRY